MQGVHVRLLVSDFPGCFRFYSEILGLMVTWGNPEDGYASFMAADGAEFSIFMKDLMAEAVGREEYPSHARCQDSHALIFKVEDLDGLAGKLKNSGVTVVNMPIDRPDWGIRVAHFRDPDGNLIELNMELARDKWTEGLQADAEKYNL